MTPSFTWPDRRPIAQLYVAAPEHRSEINPAGYLQDASLDCINPEGRVNLRERFRQWTQETIAGMRDMGAQGGACWNIDGHRYGPQYLGCPDSAAIINPEIAPIADEYFATIRGAGYKVGGCVRSDELIGSELVPSPHPYATLLRKLHFVRKRWLWKIVYIDSNVRPAPPKAVRNDWQWGPLLPASTWARLHKELSDVLFWPEHENEEYYSSSAPFSELGDAELGAPSFIREYMPTAFGIINCNPTTDAAGNAVTAEGRFDELVAAVKRGNTLSCNVRMSGVVKTVAEIMKAAAL
jgi:hypothetical protein